MIIGPHFRDDTNKWVMDIQYDAYWDILPHLVDIAQRKIIKAEELLNVSIESSAILKTMKGFDHRALQHTHDMIAASFRFKCADRLDPELPLFHDDDQKTRVLKLWREYFMAEVDRLTEFPAFTRAVIAAVAFVGTPKGVQADNFLFSFVQMEYPFDEWQREYSAEIPE